MKIRLKKYELITIISILVITIIGIGFYSHATGFDVIGILIKNGFKLDLATATCQGAGYVNCSEDPKTKVVTHGSCFAGLVETTDTSKGGTFFEGKTCVPPSTANPPQTSIKKVTDCPYGTSFNGQICAYQQQPQYGEVASTTATTPCQYLALITMDLIPCKPNAPSISIQCQYGSDIYGNCLTSPTSSVTNTNTLSKTLCYDGTTVTSPSTCPIPNVTTTPVVASTDNQQIQSTAQQIIALQEQLKANNQTQDVQSSQSTQQQINTLTQQIQTLQAQLQTQKQNQPITNTPTTSSTFDITPISNLISQNPWLIGLFAFIIVMIIAIIILARH